jgi:single-strand DNA-binding protein
MQKDRTARAVADLVLGRVKVQPQDPTTWAVANRTRRYTVSHPNAGWSCTCDDYHSRCVRLGIFCKHIEAVRITLANIHPYARGYQKEELDMSYHTLIIVGRLGRDPELKYTSTDEFMTVFSVATNYRYQKREGSWAQETTWFQIATFGKTAENCQLYLHKGSLVLVEGRLVIDPETGGPRIYERQDGYAGCAFEVAAQTVRFLSSVGGPEDEDQQEETPGEATQS